MQKRVRNSKPQRNNGGRTSARQPFACVALLLQGGGSLGAYQGGVYQALAEADLEPTWVAGISIGAINAALIAGNPPDKRVERLRAFWERVTGNPFGRWADPWLIEDQPLAHIGDVAHGLLDGFSAFQALVAGAPGFFEPRFPPPWLMPRGLPQATSYYDTGALKATLESLVDFDRINKGAMRFSVGAVNVRTGNFIYFDTATHKIGPEHILASGALPPGFPAIEIEGEYYWDGGLVSNTPLQWVVETEPREDTLAFQVDLWSSRGKLPRDLGEVAVRQKEIQFSSRTRASTDGLRQLQKIRSALTTVLRDVPAKLRKTAEIELLTEFADRKLYNIVQLVYRSKQYEGNSRDYQFSRLGMLDHWRAGREDVARAVAHPEIFELPDNEEGFQSFDFNFADHAFADAEAAHAKVEAQAGSRP
jgi:NTE family protein